MKLSHLMRPNKMSTTAWQIALRKQAVRKEKFTITAVDERNEPGSYFVVSSLTNNCYKVVYRGAYSEWNYCSCMDFKTSRLGTCKHIEGVKCWLGGKNRLHREIPPYTSVYVDYRGKRRVRIRIGSDHKEDFAALARQYFDDDFCLLDDSYALFDTFLKKAGAIDSTFRCYHDALNYVIAHREQESRTRMVNLYSDDDIDALIVGSALYPYQREGVRFACRAGKAIIADEMGLGKTIQAIASAELLRREHLVAQVLVVCPSSLKYQWKREIKTLTRYRIVCNLLSYAAVKKMSTYNFRCAPIPIVLLK